ncbi:MAG: ferrous iron transport protein A [Oscillospiraceae bacterium]|jgi:ferrous iron transport protein A|nr:ferrous iron transport protein A [Oscillospiraceae bacterium]
MTLDKGTIGETYTVTKIDLPTQVEHRLEAIGMTLGGKVSVLGGKDRGTLILKIRGARFALGRGITQRIEVA